MVNKYAVLVLGLNIRARNRITMDEQRQALKTVAGDLEAQLVGDKGSYLVTSRHDGRRVVDLVLGALLAFSSDLKIRGAALALPAVLADSLAELAKVLTARYGDNFDAEDHGIKLGADIWRAGLAIPLFPMELPAARSTFHETANVMIFGWTPGGVLVAKREARNIHWGTIVTDPAWRLLRRQEGIVVELTSRSANVLRDLVC